LVEELLRDGGKSLLETAERLELRLMRLESERRRMSEVQVAVERDLAQTEGRFAAHREAFESQKRFVARRLRTLARVLGTAPYQVLLDSKSFSDYLRKRRALELLRDDDLARIERFREEHAGFGRAKLDLERRRTNLARARANAALVLAELDFDRRELLALIQAVRDRRTAVQKLSGELVELDRALEAMTRSLADAGRAKLWMPENRGRLPFPSPHTFIERGFGTRPHRTLEVPVQSLGLHIRPLDSAQAMEIPVRAVYWGHVVHAGWLRGLGQVVILDHTKGYMTLYAHLARVDVAVSDYVKTSQHIGIMGDTGSLDGKKLYLELREEGRAVDPRPWFRPLE
jgi:septal ring factor EnvC (AmiA/AmiB activator)